MRDLDHDAACPAELVGRLLPDRHRLLLLRICVRESEAWLMADLAAYARHCGTKAARLPQVPEAFDDLKAILVHIASGRVPSLARALMRLEEVIRDG